MTSGPSDHGDDQPVLPERPVLPEQTSDDTDEGWGERESSSRDEELQRERPPHWE